MIDAEGSNYLGYKPCLPVILISALLLVVFWVSTARSQRRNWEGNFWSSWEGCDFETTEVASQAG